MKIHRIRLEHYRGVSEREIELAPCGVTVIQGPNEIGKTSHLEAITVLLDYKDDSRSELVRSLQPSGRDEAPVVEVEFASGSYHLTYRKQFLRRPKTELVIHAPERQTMTGRPAHHMVQKILGETLDEDLWRALRIDQGGRPEQAQLGSILSLGAALDRAAGEAPAGDSDVALFDRVHEEYLRYFTERGHPARAL
ncbi:MAG: AAA family ATPase, partial [Actinomycetota bacterium]